MKERINNYKAYVDGLITEADPSTDWDEVIKQHLVQLEFFKHERFIHLVVTVLFALMEVTVLTVVVSNFSWSIAALFLLILVLLVPYIAHYYLLENSVQYMYEQYDQLVKLSGKKGFINDSRRFEGTAVRPKK